MNLRAFVTASALVLSGCGAIVLAAPPPTATPTAMPVSPTPSPIPSPQATATITPTSEPTGTATPTWVPQGPGPVQVPIFMYHHIGVSPVGSRYYVPPSTFESHLELLRNWGYQSITTSMLVEAITEGAALPPRPIIITFDDANEDNYTAAFPIMQKYGFTGVLYVPYYYVGAPNYLSVAQIQEMAARGWEVGSHSLSHPTNLIFMDPAYMRSEIVGSRKQLEDLLGLPILTFAYPLGQNSDSAVDYVRFGEYIAGMGATGFTADQGPGNLFVLQRCEIRAWEDARSITRFLPWMGDPAYLPPFTPTPTTPPTRTLVPTYTQYPTNTPLVPLTP
jgi:peptidoglycan/xylan/chitin deacetylase (PgdA/CDA1 family)